MHIPAHRRSGALFSAPQVHNQDEIAKGTKRMSIDEALTSRHQFEFSPVSKLQFLELQLSRPHV